MCETIEVSEEPVVEKVNYTLWGVAAFLLLALLAVAGFKLWPIINPQVVLSVPYDPSCDLQQGPCAAKLPNGQRVILSIEPRPIPLVEPIQFHVELDGIQAKKVMVDIQGMGMNMGINRPQLQQQSAERFSGEGMLPVCIRNSMEWEARVLLDTDNGTVAAPFRFVTEK